MLYRHFPFWIVHLTKKMSMIVFNFEVTSNDHFGMYWATKKKTPAILCLSKPSRAAFKAIDVQFEAFILTEGVASTTVYTWFISSCQQTSYSCRISELEL